MKLREIVLSDLTNKPSKNEVGFNHQTRIFQLLLSRYLKGIETKDVMSLMVYCVDKIKEIEIDDYTIENSLTVKIPYNPRELLKHDAVEDKYIEYVRMMNEYIAPVFQKLNWDYSPLLQALDRIKGHGYQAEFLLKGTPKKSPDKAYTAIVTGVHTVWAFQLIAKIYDKGGLLVKQGILAEEVPHELVYARYLGKAEWIDNQTLQVSSKTSKWTGILTVD